MPTSANFLRPAVQLTHAELIEGNHANRERTFQRLREMGLHSGPTPPCTCVACQPEGRTQARASGGVTTPADEARRARRRARRAARKARVTAVAASEGLQPNLRCSACGVELGHMKGCPNAR